jgi:hypothetical protein
MPESVKIAVMRIELTDLSVLFLDRGGLALSSRSLLVWF